MPVNSDLTEAQVREFFVVPGHPELVEAGGLMSFGPSYPGMHRRAAYLRGQNLQGHAPGGFARRAPDEVRAGDQPQDREGPRPDNPAVAAAAGG
jgi:hypothetical protein